MGFVGIVICAVSYNVAHRFPVIKFYEERKAQALHKESQENGSLTRSMWRKTLWHILTRVKSHGFGIALIYKLLKDWYPVLLIAALTMLDLVRKSMTVVFMLRG